MFTDLKDNQKLITFASEYAVDRWFGSLTLGMKRGEMDSRRVKLGMLPFLLNHNHTELAGAIVKVGIQERMGYAVVEFMEDDPVSMDTMKKMGTKFRRGISPGVAYKEGGFEIDEENSNRETGFVALRATHWELVEISSVTTPANPEVGAQFSVYDTQAKEYLEEFVAQTLEEWKMAPERNPGQLNVGDPAPNPDNLSATVAAAVAAAAPGIIQGVVSQMAAANNLAPVTPVVAPVVAPVAPVVAPVADTPEPTTQEQLLDKFEKFITQPEPAAAPTASTLSSEDKELMLRLGSKVDRVEEALKAIDENTSVAEFADKMRTLHFQPKPMKTYASERPQVFSPSRLFANIIEPNKERLQNAAFELMMLEKYEVETPSPSDSLGEGTRVNIPGFLMMGAPTPEQWEATRAGYFKDALQMTPIMDVGIAQQLARFAVTTTTAASGIQTTVHRDQAYSWLIAQTEILRYCRIFSGLTGNEQIPVGSGAGSPPSASVDEAVSPVDLTPTIGDVDLTPKALRADVGINRLAIIQTAGWVDDFIREDLGMQFQSKITNGIAQGTGSAGDVTGIWNTSGVTELEYASNALSFQDFIDMETTLDRANIPDKGGRIYFMSNIMKGYSQGLKRDPGSGRFVIEFDEGRKHIGEYAVVKTNQLPNPNNGNGVVVFGDFMDFFVGLWEGFLVSVNALTNPARPVITALQFYDCVAPRGSHFVKMSQAS